jgi:glycosyltransferase involved in cell wall biosynthesis
LFFFSHALTFAFRALKIAFLTTDNREHHRRYDLAEPYFGTAPKALLQGFAEIPGLEVHVVSCTQRPLTSPEKLADNIWFQSLLVPKIGWLRTGYQGCIRATRKFLRKLQPDLVHGQGTERDCAISAVFSGFPNVITLHGIMQEQARLLGARPATFYWMAKQLERFTVPRTLGVFCNSAYTESIVQPLARRTWRVPNALRREFFETPLPAATSARKPILLNVGVVGLRKRQLDLLELAEQLHREGHAFELQFIGTAHARDKYGAAFLGRIKAAERDGFARYVGTKSLHDLIATFDAASALVHVPSEEAFGLAVAEALARNLKVFATNLGGIRDIASGIDGADLFELDDRQSLVSAIADWLRHRCPQPRTAAAEMRARYHPEVIARQHLDIYQEVLSTSS